MVLQCKQVIMIFPYPTNCSRVAHDFIAVLVSGGVAAVTLSDIETWLKIVLLALSIIFIIQGIRMRHIKTNSYKNGEKKDLDTGAVTGALEDEDAKEDKS